ncbi:AraC family transcriptional regulator [Dinghuibacter silviterrae]|uniref:AraC-like DNA-binding protein n=1 Tax=Dinghuibacter silviterrae TaxID=1539049 RepID=A0A4R8DGH0_9BACT|nr:AraC family transcriptional regulator [Dinghuibacter silviterrae]TDW96585.1 AraC-like DNA-binding protein [Dinghuibacter silviterrae]
MITAEIPIPHYPFEPDPATGNPCFRAFWYDRSSGYVKLDFLVPHRKDYFFLSFVKNGSSRHWVDMKPYVLQPNTFYFTVPHQVHLKEEPKPISGVGISFTEEFLALDESGFLKNLPLIRNPQGGHELTLGEADVVFVEGLLGQILAEYGNKGPWHQNMLLAYTKVLLIYLSRLYTEQYSAAASTPDRVLLHRFLSMIEESFAALHEVADYADRLHLSPGHLSDVVKEQSGKPAIVHIHDRLIVEAKRLLFYTDRAVKEIAFELGFEDASYFNRFFKRLTQRTPVEYRTYIREMYH